MRGRRDMERSKGVCASVGKERKRVMRGERDRGVWECVPVWGRRGKE